MWCSCHGGLQSGSQGNVIIHSDRVSRLTCRAFFSPRLLQSKRISAKDALAHPYLDEGRLRYHTCMCKCCYTTSTGRVYTSDFEPVTNPKFDDGFEKNLTSVRQVKGECLVSRLPQVTPQAGASAVAPASLEADKASVALLWEYCRYQTYLLPCYLFTSDRTLCVCE